MNETLNTAVSAVDLLVKERLGQVQALEARIQALRLTEQELQQNVAGLMEKMEWKKEYDKLRAHAREFANS